MIATQMNGSPEGWECAPECPIRLMNEQSGHLHGSGNKSDTGGGRDKGYAASSYEVAYAGRASRDYGSQGGGAARFFPNFSNQESEHSLPEVSRRVDILVGDCREVMAEMPDESVDALVTDPPAGISFMNKSWDSNRGSRNAWIAWLTEVMEEAFRVMRPGAHGLVWALPRTSHWTGMALEDAGFEVRERLAHIFGSGFPKSKSMKEIGRPELGTALKPAVEDWWLIRRPLSEKNVASNILRHGVGGLNIDATRVGAESEPVEWCECEDCDVQ